MSEWKCTLESKWEGRLKEALKKINKLTSPIGIVVFGADCAFKDEIIRIIRYEVPDLILSPDRDWKEGMRTLGWGALIRMNGEDSTSHECRHKQVQELYDARCTHVVGVYVKTVPAWSGKDGMTTVESLRYSRQSSSLNVSPPTPDGLDFFLTVSEEEYEEG